MGAIIKIGQHLPPPEGPANFYLWYIPRHEGSHCSKRSLGTNVVRHQLTAQFNGLLGIPCALGHAPHFPQINGSWNSRKWISSRIGVGLYLFNIQNVWKKVTEQKDTNELGREVLQYGCKEIFFIWNKKQYEAEGTRVSNVWEIGK